MKKRVLAALLAVCMIAATCVLFASAEEVSYKKDNVVEYVVSPVYGKELDHDATFQNLKSSKQIAATVKEKTSPGSLSASLLSNKSNFSYDDLKKICDVDTKGSNFNSAYNVYVSYTDRKTDGAKKTATVIVTVSVKDNSDIRDQKVYRVLADTVKGDSNDKVLDTYDKGRDFEELPKYQINGGLTDTITIYDVSFVEQLHGLTMGLQFYGNNKYANINASEIAQIESRYTLIDGNGAPKGTEIVSHVNSIYDLYEGQEIRLEAKLKNPKDAEDYGFKCWVDTNNNIIGKSPVYNWKAGSDPSPIYAVFEELKGRVRINYSWEGEGAIAYQEKSSNDNIIKRSLLTSDEAYHSLSSDNTTITNGQISVMEGHEVTFVFTPKEGYEVSHVYVDRRGTNNKIDVASFKSIILNDGGPSLAALKEMISATGANRTFTIEADKNRQEQIYYKFTFTSSDTTGEANNIRSIHVEFAPIKVYEAPVGKELPTVEPEGVTLATGAAPENAEGANGGAATTLPPENGAAGANGASPLSGSVVNPATGSGSGTGAIAVFTTLSLAAAGAFVTVKKRNKED